METEQLHPTWGVETLACANFAAFVEVIDKVAAEYGVQRQDLRDVLADGVDDGLATAIENNDVAKTVVLEGARRCRNAAKQQYPEHVPDGAET